jgi:hypothetical protein
MLFGEIKNGGIYKAELVVQFRNPEEIHKVSLLIRVVGIKEKYSCVEVVLLNDITNTLYYLLPSQIDPVQ